MRKQCIIFEAIGKLRYKCLGCENSKKISSHDDRTIGTNEAIRNDRFLCTCCHMTFCVKSDVLNFQTNRYDRNSYPANICLKDKFRKRLGMREYICKQCHNDLRIGSKCLRVPSRAALQVYGMKKNITGQSSMFDWHGKLDSLKTSNNFDDFKQRVLDMNLPPLPEKPVGNQCLPEYVKDKLAYSMIPNDCIIPKCNAYPVCTRGDGSCFLNALSRLWYGNEEHAVEMRLRIVNEGVRNMDLYLNEAYLFRGFEGSRIDFDIVDLYRAFGNDHLQKYRGEEFYKQELWSISKIGTYCGVWQFHQAANVLKCSIRGIYPGAGSVRKDLNRWFMPESISSCEQIGNKFVTIMWTKSRPSSDRPDHFVPIVK